MHTKRQRTVLPQRQIEAEQDGQPGEVARDACLAVLLSCKSRDTCANVAYIEAEAQAAQTTAQQRQASLARKAAFQVLHL